MKTISVLLIPFVLTGLMIVSMNQAWSQDVKNEGKEWNNFRKIALVVTTMEKPTGPSLPLDNAVRIQNQIDKILEDIIKVEQDRLNWIRETTVQQLSNTFRAKVLWGDSLNSLTGIRNLKPKYKRVVSVMLDARRSYPLFVADTGDLKPFLTYYSDAEKFFSKPANYQTIIDEIGHTLQTDLIAVCNVHFSIKVMVTYHIYVTTEVFLFYPDGTLLSGGSGSTEGVKNTSMKDVLDYKSALSVFPTSLYLALEEIKQDISKKQKKNK
ncbi:MAG: hypothetical protein NTU98_09645 [Bacteroidetes bacterium]|nr:hypothetical protein [Bacteroidota bacterium]